MRPPVRRRACAALARRECRRHDGPRGKAGDRRGELRRRLAGATVNPSFLAIHPGRRFLYAVGEIGNFEGQKTGAVNAFAIDPQQKDHVYGRQFR